MAVTPCPTCVVQTAGGTRKGKRKRTRPSRGRSSSSSSRDSRAPSQRRTRGRSAPSTPRHVGYLRRRAMALAKTLERNPSAKARQSFVTQMRNKFPDAPIRKKDSPTVAIEKALDAQEAVDEEPARARKPTKRARNGRRSSSTKRAVAAVKKRARRHMRRVLLGIVALLGAVGVGVAVRGKVKELEEEITLAKDAQTTAENAQKNAETDAEHANQIVKHRWLYSQPPLMPTLPTVGPIRGNMLHTSNGPPRRGNMLHTSNGTPLRDESFSGLMRGTSSSKVEKPDAGDDGGSPPAANEKPSFDPYTGEPLNEAARKIREKKAAKKKQQYAPSRDQRAFRRQDEL